jgi:hypothetical protein
LNNRIVLLHKKTSTPTIMMMMIHPALKMPRRYCPNSLPSARLSWLDQLPRIFKGDITMNRGVTVQGETKATSAPLVEAGESELRPWQEDAVRRSGKAIIASLSNTSATAPHATRYVGLTKGVMNISP